ncbi:ABC transporter ATP-binding protein [Thermostilla marina]
MIEYDHVSRRYGNKLAVDGLNLKIEPGELFAFLGPNGAGKTTSIKMLVGLLRPTTGHVRVCGIDTAESPQQAARYMGFVPDHPYLYEKLSGREFLSFVGQLRGLEGDDLESRIEREIERFELHDFVDDLAETYSHGMRQRVVFASAVMHDPKVLVVDEPMVGLDPKTAWLVKELLRHRTAEGGIVFMSTHTLSVAEEIADRIGIINHGKLLFLGTIDELRRRRMQQSGEADVCTLERLFLAMTAEELLTTRAPDGNGKPHAAGTPSPTKQMEGNEVSP